MGKYKVVVLEERYAHHEYEKEVLEKVGAHVVELRKQASEDEIIEVCRDADGMTVQLMPITAKVINALDKCKAIARYGVGFDNVDTKAATGKGIVVANVPDYCMEDVSDQAFALFMACVRKVSLRDRQVRAGQWNIGKADPVYRIKGKVFGIVGYGHIPQVLHRKLKGFDLGRVLVADPFVDRALVENKGAELVDMDTLIKESDYISIHAPLNDKTRHMFSTAQFKAMKNTAILVNTARGGVVDTKALYEALKTGEINSAGLDVHEQEPVPKDYPLFELDNCVLSDHAGWYSEESQIELQTKAAKAVADVLTGKRPNGVVNPDVLEKVALA